MNRRARQSGQDAGQILTQPVQLQEGGQIDAAASVCQDALERAVALDPRNVDALFNLGVALQSLERHDAAIQRYEQVLALVPGHAGAYRNLGNSLHAVGRHTEAVDAYRAALSLGPPDAVLLGSLGTALAALKLEEDAIQAFGAAVRMPLADASTWLNLAMACHNADRYDAAIEAYQQALTLRPDHAEAWQSLGWALSASDRLPAAIESHRRAATLVNGTDDDTNGQPPASPELCLSVLRDLVSVLFQAGRRAEAAEVLRTLVELAPEDAESWRHLGFTLATSDSTGQAAGAARRAS